MSRSNLVSYFLVPLLAVTFVVAWIGFSDSTPSPQVKPSTEPSQPAQYTQSVLATFDTKYLVRPVHHGPNHPPIVNDPVYDRYRIVQFPAGPGTDLEFEGDPASDYEEDVITYRFGIAIPGRLGIRSPEEALLCVDRYGSRFIIRPRSSVTPAEFASVYGNVGIVPVLPAVIYASDGKSESKPVLLNLTLVYDAFTWNSESSESKGEHPGETSDAFDKFEVESDSVDGAYAKLAKVADVSRVWRLDPPSPFTGTDRPLQATR
ncbi:MAG: hypothetical protein F4Z81_12910 [Gemmatimonadetes bacterium]|nr:hypothetical protein [Gemmatimonadota bacterium]MYB62511.1 hypothetical protein [Gemmatimonadota bacterium]